MILTPLQIFETFRRAGIPVATSIALTAIALRESAGNPDVVNDNAATGDQSYGLLQINMRDSAVASLVKAILQPPLSGNISLLIPAVNAAAGKLLWGGNNADLNVAWYIDRGPAKPGAYDYKGEYEKHLPAAVAAALASPLGAA
jgi:hypothetical protein